MQGLGSSSRLGQPLPSLMSQGDGNPLSLMCFLQFIFSVLF